MTAPPLDLSNTPQQQPAQAPETEAQRLQRLRSDLSSLHANKAPPDVIQYYLKSRGHITSPAQELAKMGPEAAPTAPLGNVMAGIGTGAATVASGIPGGKQLIGRLRSLSPNISYEDAVNDVNRSTHELLPPAARIGGEIAGAVMTGGAMNVAKPMQIGRLRTLPIGPAIPKLATPAAQGAAFGAATEALDAEPGQSLGSRALETAAGAAAGAAIPKVAESVANVGRRAGRIIAAPFRSEMASEQAMAQAGKRAVSSSALYDQAVKEGTQSGVNTKGVRDFLKHPEIAPIAQRLKQLEEFKGQKTPTPEFLDKVYKALSDAEKAIKRGAATGDKTLANMKSAELENVGTLKQQFLSVLDPVMPSYRKAVADYAEQTGVLDATRKGVQAVAASARKTTAPGKLVKESPEATEKWLKTASQEERDAFANAVTAEAAAQIRAGLMPQSLLGLFGIPHRIARSATAGDRMSRAARGLSRSTEVPPGFSPAALAALRNLKPE